MSNELNDKGQGIDPIARYLEFGLGNESYGVPLLVVREVIPLPETTNLPNGPKYFEGIMNLRGQIISILDLRKKLNIKSESINMEEAVVIVNFDGLSIGLIVDSINKVLTLNMSEVVEVPEIQSQVNAKYILGVYQGENKLTLFLDLESVLNINEIKKLVEKAA